MGYEKRINMHFTYLHELINKFAKLTFFFIGYL